MGEKLFRWLLTANKNMSAQAESPMDFKDAPMPPTVER